jgi:hypothetical protein
MEMRVGGVSRELCSASVRRSVLVGVWCGEERLKEATDRAVAIRATSSSPVPRRLCGLISLIYELRIHGEICIRELDDDSLVYPLSSSECSAG